MSEMAYKDEAQQDAEAEVEDFKEELGPFVIAAETTRMAMVFTDAKVDGHPIIFANEAFLKLTGYERNEVLAQKFDFLLAKDIGGNGAALVEAEFAEVNDDPELHYRRKDGSEFWASIFVNPVRDAEGVIVQHFISLIDTTKARGAQLNSAMLIDELNHRVKNTLATVQSIVTQAVHHASDPQVVRESIETRIAALSRSHDLLERETWDGAGLLDLVEKVLEPFSVTSGSAERYTVEGVSVRLSPKAALALGIAINELATNAVKYGAFSNTAGKVAIGWTVEPRSDGRWLSLYWREQDGPPVTPRLRRGFGSRVIEQGLRHELSGKVDLDFRPGGVVCTIDVPARKAILDEQ